MALIVRIDVDRPYGKHPRYRHLLSRISSDAFFPKIELLGYLAELEWMLQLLNERHARAYAFFRRCTLPSPKIHKLMERGGHQIGLHLENSRSLATFRAEKEILESHVGKPVVAASKHGSGGQKFGFHHFAPYEPVKYVEWARQTGLSLFFGNLEDASLGPEKHNGGLTFFPAAFWLEPYWRDAARFNIDWLLANARERDVVMLVHPENVSENPELVEAFTRVISTVPTTILS